VRPDRPSAGPHAARPAERPDVFDAPAGSEANGPRPVRAGRAERYASARAAVAGVDDPFEAWALLAARGFLPAGWGVGGEPERFFHLRRGCAGAGAAFAKRGGLLARSRRISLCYSPGVPGALCAPCPVTVERALRFAADPGAALAAESFADEAARRFAALGEATRGCDEYVRSGLLRRPPRTRVWTSPHPSEGRRAHLRLATLLAVTLLFEHIRRTPGASYEATLASYDPAAEGHHCCWAPALVERVGRRAWAEAVRSGALVPAGVAGPGAGFHFAPNAVGRPYAAFEDPFEPLGAMRELGLPLLEISPDALVIGAP
jgi:hypothetical protein